MVTQQIQVLMNCNVSNADGECVANEIFKFPFAVSIEFELERQHEE